jgi:hypothetical protein
MRPMRSSTPPYMQSELYGIILTWFGSSEPKWRVLNARLFRFPNKVRMRYFIYFGETLIPWAKPKEAHLLCFWLRASGFAGTEQEAKQNHTKINCRWSDLNRQGRVPATF